MANTTNSKISTLINSQVPFFVRNDHPNFVAFLEAYYEFLEQTGGVVERAKNIRSYQDIDLTIDEFAEKLYEHYMKLVPKDIQADKALLMKHIKDFYASRGTEKSLKFLMNILFGEHGTEFYYPKKDILRASDGKWYIQKSLRVEDVRVDGVSNNQITLLQQFANKKISGANSKAFATGEFVDQFYEGGTLINEITIGSIVGRFQNGEQITAYFEGAPIVTGPGTTTVPVYTLTANVFGGIINRINILKPGSLYKVGDPVIFESPVGSNATAVITKVSTGNITSVVVLDGGAGYRAEDYLLFTNGGDGSGANGEILLVSADSKTHPNSYNLVIDFISEEQSTPIGNNGIYETFAFQSFLPQSDLIPLSETVSNLTITTPPVYQITLDKFAGNSNVAFVQSSNITISGQPTKILDYDPNSGMINVEVGFSGNILGATVQLTELSNVSNLTISTSEVADLVLSDVLANSNVAIANGLPVYIGSNYVTIINGNDGSNTITVDPTIAGNILGQPISTATYSKYANVSISSGLVTEIVLQDVLANANAQLAVAVDIAIGNYSTQIVSSNARSKVIQISPGLSGNLIGANVSIRSFTNTSNLTVSTGPLTKVTLSGDLGTSNITLLPSYEISITDDNTRIVLGSATSNSITVEPGLYGKMTGATIVRREFTNTSNLTITTSPTTQVTLSELLANSNVVLRNGYTLAIGSDQTVVSNIEYNTNTITLTPGLVGNLVSQNVSKIQTTKTSNLTISTAPSQTIYLGDLVETSNVLLQNNFNIQIGTQQSTIVSYDPAGNSIFIYPGISGDVSTIALERRLTKNVSNLSINTSPTTTLVLSAWLGNSNVSLTTSTVICVNDQLTTIIASDPQSNTITISPGVSGDVRNANINSSNILVTSGYADYINLSGWSANSNVYIANGENVTVYGQDVRILTIDSSSNTITVTPGLYGNIISNTFNVIISANVTNLSIASAYTSYINLSSWAANSNVYIANDDVITVGGQIAVVTGVDQSSNTIAVTPGFFGNVIANSFTVTTNANSTNLVVTSGYADYINLSGLATTSNVYLEAGQILNVYGQNAIILSYSTNQIQASPGLYGGITANSFNITVLPASSNLFVANGYVNRINLSGFSANSNVVLAAGNNITVNGESITITAVYRLSNIVFVTPGIEPGLSGAALQVNVPGRASNLNVAQATVNTVNLSDWAGNANVYLQVGNNLTINDQTNVIVTYVDQSSGTITISPGIFGNTIANTFYTTVQGRTSNLKVTSAYADTISLSKLAGRSNVSIEAGNSIIVGSDIVVVTGVNPLSADITVSPGLPGGIAANSFTVLYVPANTTNLKVASAYAAYVNLSAWAGNSNVSFYLAGAINVNNEIALIDSYSDTSNLILTFPGLPGGITDEPFGLIIDNNPKSNLTVSTGPGTSVSTVTLSDLKETSNIYFETYDQIRVRGATYSVTSSNTIANTITVSPGMPGNLVANSFSVIKYPNINSTLANSWHTFIFANTGPAASVLINQRGQNYTREPSITVLANTRLTELGILGSLKINNGGDGYAIGDVIEFINYPGCWGTGAAANVVNVDANGTITEVGFIQVPGHTIGGSGYSKEYLPIANVISSTGANANVVVYSLMGDGAKFITSNSSLGAIERIAITNRGRGYTEIPTINLKSYGDGTAQANVTIIEGVFEYPGRYLNDDGHLSSYNFLEDRDFYQPFSYVVRVRQSIDKYRKAVKDLVHPAGMALFGMYMVEDNMEQEVPEDVATENSLNSATKTKTFIKTGNTINISFASHGFSIGNTVALEFLSGNYKNVTNGLYTVTGANSTNYFEVTQPRSYVSGLVILDGGSDYAANSYLVFETDYGTANGTYNLSNGSVVSGQITDYGRYYNFVPTVTANGTNTTPAIIIAILDQYANNDSGSVNVSVYI